MCVPEIIQNLTILVWYSGLWFWDPPFWVLEIPVYTTPKQSQNDYSADMYRLDYTAYTLLMTVSPCKPCVRSLQEFDQRPEVLHQAAI